MGIINKDIPLGNDILVEVSADPINGYHLSDVDFHVELRASRIKSYEKSDCFMDDDDTFILPVNTSDLGVGEILYKITAYYPDERFEDQDMKKIACGSTGRTIVK